jgi:hypothetical protein
MMKRIALVTAAATFALSGVAHGGILFSDDNGHPNLNPVGKCPPGQNQDATPGAKKKCKR